MQSAAHPTTSNALHTQLMQASTRWGHHSSTNTDSCWRWWHATDDDGNTPLHNAAVRGHTETALALINKGAKVNATDRDGDTPLHLAAYYGNTEIAVTLIAAGADVNATNEEGRTPLHYSASRGRTDIVLTLISKGADVNATNEEGRTPLHELHTLATLQ